MVAKLNITSRHDHKGVLVKIMTEDGETLEMFTVTPKDSDTENDSPMELAFSVRDQLTRFFEIDES